ncbi:M15 family metallopeptidase [Budvicia diplopodorum]|uniref:M15 family metallopeptidase n=1 Tax=Budvicia diplopodorum TaxID=1119056 RepID=UPI00135B6BDE|nr:M15 family metallopeptidase [Budvicia diplopodorum]
MITTEMLTGQSTEHLIDLCGNHRLQPAAAKAFLELQAAAERAGFNLQPASTFRDFARQQMIWNEKFTGIRQVMDAQSQPINISCLDAGQRCIAILRWSAMPGASRHHWGTDLDIYDPDLLPEGQKLLLEPWEYLENGYFNHLTQWLTANMNRYGFYRPFLHDRGGVAAEPWHLSYYPLAQEAERQLTPQTLLACWENQEIEGYRWLSQHLDSIFERYITNIDGVSS